MDFRDVLFFLLAALTSVSAIAVVVTQNIVRAATWLLFALAGTAGIFFLLGADFIGATQLLIYVGGTLVLVVFGVMLTAQGPFVTMRIGAAEWAISLLAGSMLFSVLAVSVWGVVVPPGSRRESPNAVRPLLASKHLGAALLGDSRVVDSPITDVQGGDVKMTGPAGVAQRNRTRMSYLLPFEIVSIHLLVVLVGAAYLARAKRRRGGAVT